MNRVFTVRLESEDASQLELLAKKEKRTPSAMLRILFQEGLEARELVKDSERVPEAVAV